MEYAPTLDPLDAALKRELNRGERIVWQGRPLKRISKASFGIYLFAIPWTAFALFWTVMAFVGTQSVSDAEWGWLSLAFPLFGLPFVLVGLGMMGTPFLPLFAARRTVFAVTNERLIKLTKGGSLTSETVPADRIGLVTRAEHKDGSGTLRVATKIGTDSDGDRNVETFNIGEVANILEVERAVRDLEKRADHRANT